MNAMNHGSEQAPSDFLPVDFLAFLCVCAFVSYFFSTSIERILNTIASSNSTPQIMLINHGCFKNSYTPLHILVENSFGNLFFNFIYKLLYLFYLFTLCYFISLAHVSRKKQLFNLVPFIYGLLKQKNAYN